MIELHYAQGIEMTKDIEKIYFDSVKDLEKFFFEILRLNKQDTVYLFTSNCNVDIDDSECNQFSREILIESDFFNIMSVLKYYDFDGCTLFLQEYPSFEDAYSVALDMRESHQLQKDRRFKLN